MELNNGKDIYNLCEKLWPITRSITGSGVRETLGIIQQEIPDLTIHEVLTGTQCFDWEIPKEWNIRDAYIIDQNGNKVIDFKNSNLHVVSYSTPVNRTISLLELQQHLYSIPEQPNAIPYVTSYYQERWGFCLSENQRRALVEGDYQVCIDSELSNGSLTYGELIIPGKSKKEVFLSTYICHPSMANNELSGPTVTTYLAKWIQSQPREYTYRIIFIPETIGSITYLSKNQQKLKENVSAGFNITCVGDDNAYSFLPSRNGSTLSDIVAKHVLKHHAKDFKEYSFLDRGSDERQYCSPGVDLPIASIMRTKYGEYEQYHTSLDNLDFISDKGLYGAFKALTLSIICIENNKVYKYTNLCEPQLGRRGLRSNVGAINNMTQFNKDVTNVLAYADGKKDLISIAIETDRPLWELIIVVEKLVEHNLLIEV